MKRQVSEPINVLCLTNDKQTHKQKARLCHTDMSPSASANLHRPPAANNTTTKLNITAVRLHVVYSTLLSLLDNVIINCGEHVLFIDGVETH